MLSLDPLSDGLELGGLLYHNLLERVMTKKETVEVHEILSKTIGFDVKTQSDVSKNFSISTFNGSDNALYNEVIKIQILCWQLFRCGTTPEQTKNWGTDYYTTAARIRELIVKELLKVHTDESELWRLWASNDYRKFFDQKIRTFYSEKMMFYLIQAPGFSDIVSNALNCLEVAERNAKELIESEELEKKDRQKFKSKKRGKNARKKAQKKGEVLKQKKEEKKSDQAKETFEAAKPDQPVDPIKLREVFYGKLHTSCSSRTKHLRVDERWKTKNPRELRKLTDKSQSGNIVQRYSKMNLKDLFTQRAKHFMPKLERLLEPPYINFYAQKMERGYAFIAKLELNGKEEQGMIVIGCNDHKIYHQYFVSSEKIRDYEIPSSEGVDESFEEAKSDDQDIEVIISEDTENIVSFDYGTHRVSIYPFKNEELRRELGMSLD